MTLVAAFTFLCLRIADIEGLFGVFSTLTLRFDWTHTAALGAGLLALVWSLRAYVEPFFPPLLGIAAGLAALGYYSDAPYHLGLAWLIPTAIWALPSKLLAIRILPPEPVRIRSEWIRNIFQRGAKITSLRLVYDLATRQVPLSSEHPIYFGFQQTPVEHASGHFMIPGAPGTGKTMLLRLMMQSVLPRITPGSRQRALIFDAKHEMVSVVAGMRLFAEVRILNPFDERCSVWDVAKDFKTPSDALQLAKLLYPENEKEADPFWSKSARGVLSDVILAHILRFKDGKIPHWSLSDIIRSLQSKDQIEAALAMTDRTKDALRNIHEEKTYHGVLATLDLVRREFEVLAALWDKPSEDPERLFSLTEWMEESGILILAPSATAEKVINPLNRLFIERIGDLLLESPDVDPQSSDPQPRTWMFLDELHRMGRLPRLETLLHTGRSKGLICSLAFQDISSLRETYGEKYAAAITGACTHKLMFQAPSPEHAAWCAEVIGSEEVIELASGTSKSVSTGPSGITTTYGQSTQASEKTKPLFTKDEFLYLGKPGEATPVLPLPAWYSRLSDGFLQRLVGAFYATCLFSPIQAIACVQGRVYRGKHSFTDVIEALTPKEGPDFIPRPDAEQFLVRWNDAESSNLPAVQEAQTEKPKVIEKPEALDIKTALFNIRSQKPKTDTPQ